MKFCIKCDNMYYLRINNPESIQNELVHYCRHCGYEDNIIENDGLCLTRTDVQENIVQNFNNIINPYTKMDPTLPRIYNMKCPNESCKTNNEESIDKQTEIIYIRYDETNMKYLYICPTCDINWLSK